MKQKHHAMPWWLPFAYFSPSMVLFLIYPISPYPWWSETIDFIFVFGFATINFIAGVFRLFQHRQSVD